MCHIVTGGRPGRLQPPDQSQLISAHFLIKKGRRKEALPNGQSDRKENTICKRSDGEHPKKRKALPNMQLGPKIA